MNKANQQAMKSAAEVHDGSNHEQSRAQSVGVVAVPSLLRIRTVAAVAGLSPSTIYRMVAAGTFPPPVYPSRRCTRWPAELVLAWLEKQSAAGKERGEVQ